MINVVGGAFIGVIRRPFYLEAAQIYTILTIGDGLVGQIYLSFPLQPVYWSPGWMVTMANP